jgi:hypothetical protein
VTRFATFYGSIKVGSNPGHLVTYTDNSGREHNAWNMETTAVINGIDAGQPLSTGQLDKIAVLTPYSGPAYMP